ncbi:hypothetical protein SISSUDRAFT_1043696, partial [Sistotremastrum suecicum HHB10207 ss-3]
MTDKDGAHRVHNQSKRVRERSKRCRSKNPTKTGLRAEACVEGADIPSSRKYPPESDHL